MCCVGRRQAAPECCGTFGTVRNRRTRTRMSGGEGGGRAILPATRFGCHVSRQLIRSANNLLKLAGRGQIHVQELYVKPFLGTGATA